MLGIVWVKEQPDVSQIDADQQSGFRHGLRDLRGNLIPPTTIRWNLVRSGVINCRQLSLVILCQKF